MLRAMAEAKGLIRDAAKAGRDWPRVEKRMQEIRHVRMRRLFWPGCMPRRSVANENW